MSANSYSSDNKIKCQLCSGSPKPEISRAHLTGHLAHHLEYLPIGCTTCGEQFGSKEVFECHVRQYNHPKEFTSKIVDLMDQMVKLIENTMITLQIEQKPNMNNTLKLRSLIDQRKYQLMQGLSTIRSRRIIKSLDKIVAWIGSFKGSDDINQDDDDDCVIIHDTGLGKRALEAPTTSTMIIGMPHFNDRKANFLAENTSFKESETSSSANILIELTCSSDPTCLENRSLEAPMAVQVNVDPQESSGSTSTTTSQLKEAPIDVLQSCDNSNPQLCEAGINNDGALEFIHHSGSSDNETKGPLVCDVCSFKCLNGFIMDLHIEAKHMHTEPVFCQEESMSSCFEGETIENQTVGTCCENRLTPVSMEYQADQASPNYDGSADTDVTVDHKDRDLANDDSNGDHNLDNMNIKREIIKHQLPNPASNCDDDTIVDTTFDDVSNVGSDHVERYPTSNNPHCVDDVNDDTESNIALNNGSPPRTIPKSTSPAVYLYTCQHCPSFVSKYKASFSRHEQEQHKNKSMGINNQRRSKKASWNNKAVKNMNVKPKTKSSVAAHNNRPFQCRHHGCSYKGKKHGHLKIHTTICHPKNTMALVGPAVRFFCDLCNGSYASKSNLSKHVTMKHKQAEIPMCSAPSIFTCSRCSYTTRLRCMLTCHYQRLHTSGNKRSSLCRIFDPAKFQRFAKKSTSTNTIPSHKSKRNAQNILLPQNQC